MQLDMFSSSGVSDTRMDALRRIEPRANLLRQRIKRFLINNRRNGGTGLTADECASCLNLSLLSVRPRFTELSKDGVIVDTGRRRKNASGCSAKVWIVSDHALKQEED